MWVSTGLAGNHTHPGTTSRLSRLGHFTRLGFVFLVCRRTAGDLGELAGGPFRSEMLGTHGRVTFSL